MENTLMNVLAFRTKELLCILRSSVFVLAIVIAACSSNSCLGDGFGLGDHAFEIEFVTIGNPGNAPDLDNNPRSYLGHPGAVPVGGVDYEYRIGKYEISRGQIEKANTLGNLGITMLDMTEVRLNLQQPTANEPELPATGISWYEAATFVNWLNASEGYQEAYKVRDNEFFVWDPSDAGYDPSNIFRNRLAHYFLPSVHEWYKAAFYDAEKDVYYHYATGSDTPPERVAFGTAPGTAVYHQRRPALVTQAGGLSPYGTMAQSGNVWEWEESDYKTINRGIHKLRGLRSGDWGTDAEHVSADYRNPFPPEIENQLMSFGFRVASIVPSIIRGDFNANGVLDADDIDQITPSSPDLAYDLTNDGTVNDNDRQFWVHHVARTWFGDSNLDGRFTSHDLIAVMVKGEYEDLTNDNSNWESGDWNGDSEFTSDDLILALQDGGYEGGPRPAAMTVPDCSGGSLLLVAGILGAAARRHWRCAGVRL